MVPRYAYMTIKLFYCLACPLFLSQNIRLCHGASKAPRPICQQVVLRVLLSMLAISTTPKRLQIRLERQFSMTNMQSKSKLLTHLERQVGHPRSKGVPMRVKIVLESMQL